MNIAIVIERFDPRGGGAEKSTAQIAHHLVRRGHQVTILAWSAKPWRQEPRVCIRSHSKHERLGAFRLLRFSQWAGRCMAEGRFDTSLSVTTAVAAPVLQPRGGTVRETLERNVAVRTRPWSRTAKRILISLSVKPRVQLWLERRTFQNPRIRRIIAVSRYVQDQLHRHYGIGRDRVEIIPNASEMPRLADDQRSRWRRTVRKGFGIGPDTTVFLFAAHNPGLKGASTLLRATRRLQQRNTDIVILIAGKLCYPVQRQAATLGVRSRVRFVGPTDQMAALYCASDVTVLPTYYDTSSKVVIESLMMGVPAISTVYNGASDLIIGNGCGRGSAGRVLADPGDAEALAAAMADLADPTQRRLCQPAMAALAEQLGMQRHVDRLETVLVEAAGTDGR